MKVIISCTNGHTQEIELHNFTREMAIDWCTLLDGTNPMYVYSPIGDPVTRIGKCGICNAQITAKPEEN